MRSSIKKFDKSIPPPMQDFLQIPYETQAPSPEFWGEDYSHRYQQHVSTQKKRFLHAVLSSVFAHAGGQRVLPRIGINSLLSGAHAVLESRVGSGTHVPMMSDRLTHVVTDGRHPDRALIVSYDHHMVYALKGLIDRLNPTHQYNSQKAPTVDACTELYSRDAKGRVRPSGAMLVIRNFQHLAVTEDTLGSVYSEGCHTNRVYIELAQQLSSQVRGGGASASGMQQGRGPNHMPAMRYAVA